MTVGRAPPRTLPPARSALAGEIPVGSDGMRSKIVHAGFERQVSCSRLPTATTPSQRLASKANPWTQSRVLCVQSQSSGRSLGMFGAGLRRGPDPRRAMSASASLFAISGLLRFDLSIQPFSRFRVRVSANAKVCSVRILIVEHDAAGRGALRSSPTYKGICHRRTGSFARAVSVQR